MSSFQEISAQFDRASIYVMHNHSCMSNDVLVEMYGYYKQATVGSCNTPKPSLFDFAAKLKWKSWRKKSGMSTYSAMSQYVQCLNSAVNDWDTPDLSGAVNGIAVSSMCITDEHLPEDEKTIFDFVKENNLENLKRKKFDPNCTDQGLALLHWATDRGNLEIVRFLVEERKANINCLDDEGLTPLHYAAACDYPNIVEYLIQAGADFNIVDKNNCTPKDIAENQQISSLFPN